MSLKTFITKWEAQLKAVNPKYDVVYEVSKDEPIHLKTAKMLDFPLQQLQILI